MPKIEPFNIDNYNDNSYKAIMLKELEKKIKKVSFHGMTATVRLWGSNISNEDLEKFKNSPESIKLLEKHYKEELEQKKKKYNQLKEKCDFCLHDVKPYKKLLENIDSFTYCGATTELEAFEKRYIKSKGYTKAKFRARAQEFSKIKCV